MRGRFVLGELLSTPWALRPDVLSNHVQILTRWAFGNSTEPPQVYDDGREIGERITAFEARSREANARTGSQSIAAIPVFGTITQRAGIMTEWCGGTSTEQVSSALADAVGDPSIAQILMIYDTPGGGVFGVPELADQINEAKQTKPIVGFANSLSASAGYWAMSQCSECYITPGGEVGSIGVWSAHEDYSRALETAGISVTMISAGKFKTEGNPYEPLNDEGKAFMQSRVDDYYRMFTKAVARGRGASVDTVRSDMGGGRCLGANQAKEAGMVDGIATLGDVISSMQRKIKSSAPRASRLAAAQRELAIMG